MAAVQTEDIRASFLFVGELNGHHQEWLGSTTTNSHGVAPFDFATVSSCDQLVVGPTHARGGTLDLLMTDVPDLIRVAVVASIGNSDHSSLSAVISMAQAILNLCVNMKVFHKHQINWNTVCGAIQDLPWRNIWLADNPVEVLDEHLSLMVLFNLFLKRTADVMASRLSVVFRRHVRLGSFPACWRQANVTPIPKGPPSSSVANY